MAMPMPCLEVHGLQTGLSYKQPLLRCGGGRGGREGKGGEGWGRVGWRGGGGGGGAGGFIATPALEVLRCQA